MPYDAKESLAGEVVPLQLSSSNSLDIVKNNCVPSARRSSHHHSTQSVKLMRYEGIPHDHAMKFMYASPPGHGSMIVSRHSLSKSHFTRESTRLNEGNEKLCGCSTGDCQLMKNHFLVASERCNSYKKKPSGDAKDCSMCLESSNSASLLDEGATDLLSSQKRSKSGTSCYTSPRGSLYTPTRYTEANQSFTNTETSECSSSIWRTGRSGEVSNSCDLTESRSTDIHRGTSRSNLYSNSRSMSNSPSSPMYRRPRVDDKRWEAVQAVTAHNNGALELNNFRILKRLGKGDIGTVYLTELIGTGIFFAMKVMDKDTVVSRKKIIRAQTEKEILLSLNHPFLPTLYTHFETERLSLLVMEFCPGGDLYTLRQKQPGKFFPEDAARFYLAEVLLALEYLHMLGIIYRDLKPENILVREDGHIMLSDFDLSLRCTVHPTLVKSSSPNVVVKKNSRYCIHPACLMPSCSVHASCIRSTCFSSLVGNPKKEKKSRPKIEAHNGILNPLPELIVEPTSARSMSFVGTHEYLAPEIIKGEGHGSAVDWWTFGIFLYELLFGATPFRGTGNRATLFNIVWQPLRFPETPTVSFAARDLIRGLLVKEPQHRLAYRRGATEIKQHPFFQNVNWALIRCAKPPEVPSPFSLEDAEEPAAAPVSAPAAVTAAAPAPALAPADTTGEAQSMDGGEPSGILYRDVF